MHLCDGNKLSIAAPAGGFVKDEPCLVGALLVVPSFSAEEGVAVSCMTRGLFNGPIKAGDNPVFDCSPVYFDGVEFTKTVPSEVGDVIQPIGVFVDGGVLLTGGLITELKTA